MNFCFYRINLIKFQFLLPPCLERRKLLVRLRGCRRIWWCLASRTLWSWTFSSVLLLTSSFSRRWYQSTALATGAMGLTLMATILLSAGRELHAQIHLFARGSRGISGVVYQNSTWSSQISIITWLEGTLGGQPAILKGLEFIRRDGLWPQTLLNEVHFYYHFW